MLHQTIRHEDYLKGMTVELAIADNVIFTGFRSDIPRISKAILMLLEDRETAEKIGRTGRKQVVKLFQLKGLMLKRFT